MESEESVDRWSAVRCRVRRLRLWHYGLDCRCSLVSEPTRRASYSQTEEAVEDEREECRRHETPHPPSTGHWEQGGGWSFSHLDEELKRKKKWAVFHLLFIWMLSLLLVCLLSWNSVISLILKFKYIDFYLVYRYLFNFSVGEFVCECVWGCVMHVAYCMRTCEGMWS